MSNRTNHLPPLTGLSRQIREMRYHEFGRQGVAVLLILLFALTAKPTLLSVWIGLPIAVLGMLVRLYASGFVFKNKALATSGPYAFVRHPLYTGNILLLVGFAIAGATLWGIPVTLAFLWFYYPPAIAYEDRKLHEIFGEQWQTWSARTPALFPTFRGAARRADGGRWTLRRSMWRNGEVFIAVYIVICMWVVIARLP
jgi:protein-S-isoprenylcysteine O-methyltransferase Ste14